MMGTVLVFFWRTLALGLLCFGVLEHEGDLRLGITMQWHIFHVTILVMDVLIEP